MADDSSQAEGELTLEAHLQFAVRAIEADPHLRVLARYFLTFCSVLPQGSVFDINPVNIGINNH